ncbi:hypothetical protein DSO57_1015612 [Entomophthora muscae]|uniref:Uncharacterized protein n=1 Tax=Entomophthora muscae TaxID=34485 RepID=A0ACC2SI49_9FUNG|nr:hypothetical protein DSO57_1015612 [Entomophthora muscae]
MVVCKEVIVSRLDYDTPTMSWKCHVHASQETSSSETATCDSYDKATEDSFPRPNKAKRNQLHWSDILLSPDTATRKGST